MKKIYVTIVIVVIIIVAALIVALSSRNSLDKNTGIKNTTTTQSQVVINKAAPITASSSLASMGVGKEIAKGSNASVFQIIAGLQQQQYIDGKYGFSFNYPRTDWVKLGRGSNGYAQAVRIQVIGKPAFGDIVVIKSGDTKFTEDFGKKLSGGKTVAFNNVKATRYDIPVQNTVYSVFEVPMAGGKFSYIEIAKQYLDRQFPSTMDAASLQQANSAADAAALFVATFKLNIK